jgi:hypothetical protein
MSDKGNFDKNGNLTPYEIVEYSLTEIECYFVDGFPNSITRKNIYDGLVNYILDIGIYFSSSWSIWIDGSFITTKLNPEDIDIVNIFEWNETLNDNRGIFEDNFWADKSKKAYKVDANFMAVYSKNDSRYIDTIEMTAYWHSWFGKSRQPDKFPKGFIELKITNSI